MTSIRRFLQAGLVYLGIIVVTLAAVDGVCMLFGLFPPQYHFGEPDLGWVPARATGAMHVDKCEEFSTGKMVEYMRDEAGVRTSAPVATLLADSAGFKIGISGDSQTDLCAPNDQTFSGVMERELRKMGIPATALAYGAGRYSPLQDYIAYKKVLRPLGPKAFVLNLYTGNDFYDIMRVDDRPHLEPADSGYVVAKPVWYLYDDPAVHYHSRVLYLFRAATKALGIRGLYVRLRVLMHLAEGQGKGLGTVIAYVNDLRHSVEPSVGYDAAFAAQFLNQQLFFYRFPRARAESIKRIAWLMELIRRENPNLLLVMSPLPSYELAGRQPLDSALTRTLARLPISYASGVREERELYETLRRLSSEHGWLFVDNLAALAGYAGSDRLFNDFDYHLLPPASELIGRQQAQVIGHYLETHR